MAPIHTETVALQVADGTAMNAFVATPADGRKLPGLLVFQEIFGVNGHIRDVTERFAAQGYVAIALDLFHRTAPGFEETYDHGSIGLPHAMALTPVNIIDDARAAFDWLRQNPRVLPDSIACVGFCFGGRVSFVANSALPLKAAISFYGGRIAPDLLPLASEMQGPMLFFWGGLDTHIPPEQIRSITDVLTQAKKTFTNVEISDAGHGFFCDVRAAYNQNAAKQAWNLSLTFLTTYLKG
jgi:carboxymethylenebutenolidase